MADSSPSFDYNAMQKSIEQSADPIMTPSSIATPQSDGIYYDDLKNRIRYLTYRIVAPASSCTVANIVGGSWYVPFAGNLPQMSAYVDTPGTTGNMAIAVRFGNGTTTTINTINIATGDQGSPLYTSPSGGANFVRNNEFHFNITSICTTPALGLTIVFRLVEQSK